MGGERQGDDRGPRLDRQPGAPPASAQDIAAQQREEFRLRELQRKADEHAEQHGHEAVPASPAPAPAPVMREPAPAPVMPRVDPEQLLSEAGLQMVETDRIKAKQIMVEPEPVQLGRPRRERPKPAAEEAELMQVETRNK